MWQLETDRGRFAVKELNRDHSDPDYVQRYERAFVVELAAYKANVPMPRPVPVPDTPRCLAELDDSDEPVTVRVHEWIDGENAARIEVTLELARSVGDTQPLRDGRGLRRRC